MRQETIEGNKMIAEFMGWKFEPTNDPHWINYIPPTNNSFIERNIYMERLLNRGLGYQKRWETLMPVVEKIEFELGATIIRRKMFCEIHYREDDKSFTDIKEEKQPISAVWQIVVSFITWYNTTQKH